MANTRMSPRYWNFVDEIDRELQEAILRLLGSRGPGHAMTLRDAAVAVGGESWRALLNRALSVAQGLAAAGLVEIVQGGASSFGSGAAGSTVRLKLRQPAHRLTPSRLN